MEIALEMITCKHNFINKVFFDNSLV